MNDTYSVGTIILSRASSPRAADRCIGIVIEVVEPQMTIRWGNKGPTLTYGSGPLCRNGFIFVSPENYEDLYELL